MNNNGWIKLHRQMFDNKLWLSEPFTKAQAWVDLFANANHDDASFWVRGIEVKMKRGQIGWSELTMAKRWGWSRMKVRRFLLWLESEQNVRQQKSRITSIITILNYDKYQTRDNRRDNNEDNRRDTDKKYKKDKEEDSKADALRGDQWNALIDGFKEVNPSYLDFYKNRTERNALEGMSIQWGYEKLLATIQALPNIINQPYAPKITSPTELKRGMGKLVAFYRQEQGKSNMPSKNKPNYIL